MRWKGSAMGMYVGPDRRKSQRRVGTESRAPLTLNIGRYHLAIPRPTSACYLLASAVALAVYALMR